MIRLKDSLSTHSFDSQESTLDDNDFLRNCGNTSVELGNITHQPHTLSKSFLNMTRLSLSDSTLHEEFNTGGMNRHDRLASSCASVDNQGYPCGSSSSSSTTSSSD